MRPILLTLIAALALLSCDLLNQDEYSEEYVVQAFLKANDTLPEIQLTRTLPVDEFYSFENAAVSGGNVTISLMDGETVSETYPYAEISPGIYHPATDDSVKAAREYRLDITFDDNDDHISARTFVPDTFRVIRYAPEEAFYQSPEQFEVTVSRSFTPGRQNIFIFSIVAGEPTTENLTPFYADALENDETLSLEDLRVNQSNIVNEENYEQNEDGTITLQIPWIAIAFYGPNTLVMNAVDDNTLDFFRSQSVQLGGSTISPGQIENVIDHVEGGIGVFGSFAADSIDVSILRPPGF